MRTPDGEIIKTKIDLYKWITTHGVDEESILKDLPLDLRRDIKRHLCVDLVRRVSFYCIYHTCKNSDRLLDAKIVFMFC